MDRPTERQEKVEAVIDALIDAGDDVQNPDTATSANDILPEIAAYLREETGDTARPDGAGPPDLPSERT